MPPKVLIGVNLVQLAQPFDRDTRSSSSSSLVSYSAVCKDIINSIELYMETLAWIVGIFWTPILYKLAHGTLTAEEVGHASLIVIRCPVIMAKIKRN